LREHQRLLYVAMTRARDHLVMIGTLNSGRSPIKPDTWLSYFHQAVPSRDDKGPAGDRILVSSYPEWQSGEMAPDQGHGAPAAAGEERPRPAVDANSVLDNLARIPVSGSGEWKKATDYLLEKRELHPEEQLDAPIGGVSPLIRGSILHRCLEDLARHGSYDLDRIAQEFPAIGALAGDDRKAFLREAGALVGLLAANAELAWVFERNENAHAELPFLLRKGADLVSGVIDRIIIRENSGIVIDYKAIRIKDEADLASWNEHYLPQIRIYCEAVKQIFRVGSVDGYLFYLDSARLEKITML
ncbi:MAG TPA: PD-(D/E)XK nuclease family protein, partial [Nitrospirota bacterium]|nr:PD-(D/E)XK nuclease family protein [Nitrospirota bacterium]